MIMTMASAGIAAAKVASIIALMDAASIRMTSIANGAPSRAISANPPTPEQIKRGNELRKTLAGQR